MLVLMLVLGLVLLIVLYFGVAVCPVGPDLFFSANLVLVLVRVLGLVLLSVLSFLWLLVLWGLACSAEPTCALLLDFAFSWSSVYYHSIPTYKRHFVC